MGPTARWGITLPLRGMPLPDQREIVSALPDLGYTDVWSAEMNGWDAFTPLALVAHWSSRLRLGTAIAGIYTRGPALLAMNAATLATLAPGRFVLGIGVSSAVIVEQWNGIPLAKPYQRSRDTLRFLRAALAGEKVTEEYETFSVQGFRLEQAPEPPPALALAALRPGMVALAASLADGAITNWLSPGDVAAVRAAAGPDCELIARVFVCPTTDPEAARAIGRRLLAAPGVAAASMYAVAVAASFSGRLRAAGSLPRTRGRVPGQGPRHAGHRDRARPRSGRSRRGPRARTRLRPEPGGPVRLSGAG